MYGRRTFLGMRDFWSKVPDSPDTTPLSVRMPSG
jgi:hypothetical protein